MALTPTQEAQVLQLIAEQAALLSLADNEATIISKLGATKVNLSSLGSAATFDDADIMLIRQGTTDLSIAGSVVKAAVAVPDATDTVKGKSSLAVAANFPSASDTESATPAYVAAAVSGVGAGVYSANQVVTTGTTFSITHVGRAIEIDSASATAHNLPAASAYASGKAISFANINIGIATVNRAGSDTITGCNLAAATAIPLNNGENVTLVSDGASKWYVAASNVTFFGAPRAWQNLTASRDPGVTYTNSTGRPIYVSVSGSNATPSTAGITVNGVTVQGSASSAATSAQFAAAEVPLGATYIVGSTAGTFIKVAWTEFR